MNEIERISSLIKIDNEMIAKALQDAGGMIVIEGWRGMWDRDPSGLLSSIRDSAAEYDGWVKDVAATENCYPRLCRHWRMWKNPYRDIRSMEGLEL